MEDACGYHAARSVKCLLTYEPMYICTDGFVRRCSTMLGRLPPQAGLDPGFRDVYIRNKAPVHGVFPSLLCDCCNKAGPIAST